MGRGGPRRDRARPRPRDGAGPLTPDADSSHVLVVADGEAPSRVALDQAWPGWADGIDLVIAADGGARTAEALGFRIDLVVGDGDSLRDAGVARLRAAGVEVRGAAVDKDETDTELAVIEAVDRGATRITIVGALGGERLDHELANIALLAHPVAASTPAQILDPRGRFTVVRAPGPDDEPVTRSLPGAPGSLVSLLAMGSHVDGITTVGLRYRLADESLRLGPARGLSNIRTARHAAVTVRRGLLLVVEAPATLGR